MIVINKIALVVSLHLLAVAACTNSTPTRTDQRITVSSNVVSQTKIAPTTRLTPTLPPTPTPPPTPNYDTVNEIKQQAEDALWAIDFTSAREEDFEGACRKWDDRYVVNRAAIERHHNLAKLSTWEATVVIVLAEY